MIKTKEAGKCPYCNSENINYGDTTLDAESLAYNCTCNDCKQDFQEWYVLEYCETIGHGKSPIAEEIRQSLEGMPCPMDTRDYSDSMMLKINKELENEMQFEFGTTYDMEDDKVDQFWWETLERIARQKGIRYYEDED